MNKKDNKGSTIKTEDIVAASICVILTCLLMAYVVFGDVELTNANTDSGVIIRNYGSLVTTIRTGLREHSKTITVSFHAKNDHMSGIETLVSELIEEALKETTRADEGDYIRYQYGGYQVRYSNAEDDKGYLYKVRIIPEYYTYPSQEKWVSDEVKRIILEMDFSKKATDYERVTAIYDYVCDNVSYDVVHKNKKVQHTKTTAYAALKYKTAVCQGYSVLLYRLLKEAGIDNRIITGMARHDGSEEYHSWNLVCIDGKYYNVDATWDTAFGTRDYYLKSDSTFSKDHEWDEIFTTDEFLSRYPVAIEDIKNEN